jgi:hypothetical protein
MCKRHCIITGQLNGFLTAFKGFKSLLFGNRLAMKVPYDLNALRKQGISAPEGRIKMDGLPV